MRKDRNDSSVPAHLFNDWSGRWKDWFAVLSYKKAKNFEERKRKLPGYRVNLGRLKQYLKGIDDGIYEWRMIGEKRAYVEVIYVGETDSVESKQSLYDRILDYTQYDSHKREEFNELLKKKFDLEVRVLAKHGTGRTTEQMEARALEEYTYPLNKKNQAVPEESRA